MASDNLTKVIKAEENEIIYEIKGKDAIEILKDLMRKGKEYVNINFVLNPDLKYPEWRKYFKNSIENSIVTIGVHFIDTPGEYKINLFEENKRSFEINLKSFLYRERMKIVYEL
ncbi:hypothetical protein COS79_03790 [Candidatus Woesearchaeota archaeon CG06_land_8_20_14_3_00_33_13]|nr:MAG: hypothetical protein COV14_05755 [Candidatus Woesearchaeota archaeon CG10_big_fil_rev_8_21_14_0_10_33_12]PIU72276.1 MAG: hypothetical protein COS79_03790 [Candidatus Woesearchaeota archaeon CG06_land_8_20_14_3_00_33_13]